MMPFFIIYLSSQMTHPTLPHQTTRRHIFPPTPNPALLHPPHIAYHHILIDAEYQHVPSMALQISIQPINSQVLVTRLSEPF